MHKLTEEKSWRTIRASQLGFIVQSDPLPETVSIFWKSIVEAQARENSNQVRNDFKPFATGEGANVVDQLE